MNKKTENEIFTPSLKLLNDIDIFGPESFKEYAKKYNFHNLWTAELISVDFK